MDPSPVVATPPTWTCKVHGTLPIAEFRIYDAPAYKGVVKWKRYKCKACVRTNGKKHEIKRKVSRLVWGKENKDHLVEYNKQYLEANPDKRESFNAARRVNQQDLRLEVLRHYSGSDVPFCVCCKESRFKVLCLDHINGDGAERRRLTGKKTVGYWRLVKKEGFPPNYRVLCHNCNMSSHFHGGCPHQPEFHVNDSSSPSQRYHRKLRTLVLDHFGNKCNCCDEATPEFLAVDHVEGGGRAHRKSAKLIDTPSFNRWLIANDFPPGFQLLCHNCNFEKGSGSCPSPST